MLYLFVKLTVASMGIACWAASLLTWRDGASHTPGPVWWTVGWLLFTVSALAGLLPTSSPVHFLELASLHGAVAFQAYGFARHYQLAPRWPLAVLLAAGLVTAGLAAFPLAHDPQAQSLVSAAFYPVVLVGGVVHLLALGEGRGALRHLGALLLISGLGIARFAQALVWKESWYWFQGGPGDYLLALMIVINLAALAFYQLRLVNRRYLKHIGGLDRELAQSQREILLTLAEVIENSSHETAGHVARVGIYAAFLARALGRSEAEARRLGEASHLHDIGKIGVPDRILEWEGPLDRDDFRTMQTHTTIGHGILARTDRPVFQLAARIALEHHENWDGTGYPRGLRGTAISLEGRIVALCDVFDALSQKRAYKEPWPLDRIFEHIEQQRGRKFDPALVDLWLVHRDQIEALVEASTKVGVEAQLA